MNRGGRVLRVQSCWPGPALCPQVPGGCLRRGALLPTHARPLASLLHPGQRSPCSLCGRTGNGGSPGLVQWETFPRRAEQRGRLAGLEHTSGPVLSHQQRFISLWQSRWRRFCCRGSLQPRSSSRGSFLKAKGPPKVPSLLWEGAMWLTWG